MSTKEYANRCCDKRPAGPLSPPLEKVSDDVCSHEFMLVRIDRKTGQIDHVPHLDGVVALSRLDVDGYEWKEGPPE